MQIKYKLLAFLPSIMLTGCTECFFHENVVQDMTSDKLLIKDIKDNKERIVYLTSPLSFVSIGDTVYIFTRDSKKYLHQSFFADERELRLNMDLINQRRIDSVKNAMLLEHRTKQK